MSNNPGRHSAPAEDINLPRQHLLLAADYNNHKAAIRRNPNYQETLGSIKKAFSALESTPNEHIRLCAHFEEFNDALRITEDLWSELLPGLTLVKVMLDAPAQADRPERIRGK